MNTKIKYLIILILIIILLISFNKVNASNQKINYTNYYEICIDNNCRYYNAETIEVNQSECKKYLCGCELNTNITLMNNCFKNCRICKT